MVKIHSFRGLKTNRRLTTIPEAFIQEKSLDSGKNSDLCGVSAALIPAPSPRNSSVALRIHRLATLRKAPYYHTVTRHGAMAGATLQMDLQTVSQTQKTIRRVIGFMWDVQSRQLHGDRKQVTGWQGLGVRSNGLLLGMIKMVQNQAVVRL